MNGIMIPDFFTINKWRYREYSLLIFITLLLFDIIYIFEAYLDYKIPVIRQILGFILITFIPGFCVLRILRIDNFCRVTNLVFAVGLSLSLIMIFGFVIDIIFIITGIYNTYKLFTPNITIAFLNILIFVLLLISPKDNQKYKKINVISIDLKYLNIILALFFILFLSIFGSYMVTYYNNPTLTLIALFIISVIPIIVIYARFPDYLHPFVIFIVALSLLYHVNLVSNHLWSFDIFFEAFSTRTVLNDGVWIPNLRYKANSLLLMTILAPIYSLICGIDYVWVFKVIFPVIFAFTPLAMYILYKKYYFPKIKFDNSLAFLSVLIFIFYYGFFKNMPDKQYIAELFLILILINIVLIISESRYNKTNYKILLTILTFSIVTIHYGVSYLFMITLFLLILIFFILKIRYNIYQELFSFIKNYFMFYITLVLGWYIFVAGGNKYELVVSLGRHIVEELINLQVSIERSGLCYAIHKGVSSPLWTIYKLIYIILQIFILIGILYIIYYLMMYRENKVNIDKKNIFLSFMYLIFYIFLLIQIVMTYGMGFDRIFQITLTLLSPTALIGLIIIIKFISRNNLSYVSSISKKIFVIFLSIFILFNSGFIFKVTNDTLPPYCIGLNKSAGWPVYSEGEVQCVMWLKSHENTNFRVSAFNMWHAIKSRDGILLSEFYPENEIARLTPYRERLSYGTYIYLGKISKHKVKITGLSEFGGYVKLKNTIFYKKVIVKSQKIYDCDDATIYLYS